MTTPEAATAADISPPTPGLTARPWLIHALYAAAIVAGAALLAVGLRGHSAPPSGTLIVPGTGAVRIIIDGPPSEMPTVPDPMRPRWSDPLPRDGAGPGPRRGTCPGGSCAGGAQHPDWCQGDEACSGDGAVAPPASRRSSGS